MMTQADAYRELLSISSRATDWRDDRGKRFLLREVIFVAIVAVIAGAQDCEDIAEFGKGNIKWFRQFLSLPHGLPAHDLYLDVFAMVKPEQFEELVRAWTSMLCAPGALTVEGRQVAYDGQSLRGSVDRAEGLSRVHLVSAYLVESGVTLGTLKVDDKSNEITAIPDLIRSLKLGGATISTDAMGCQREIAACAREAGAHYLLQVKENQPKLLEDIRQAAAEIARRRKPGEQSAVVTRHRDVDKGHGRIETRVCILSHDLSGIEKRGEWQDLAGIAVMLREREDVISKKKSQETSYYILSNRAASAADIAGMIRNHWAIENNLHWSMDVVWGSDAHQVRDRNAAENLGRVRRFCAGLVKQVTGWGMSGKRVRKRCGWNPDQVLQVLSGQVIERERGRRPNRPKTGPRAKKMT